MREAYRHDIDLTSPLDGASAGDDARRAPRFTMLIRAAKLKCPEGEFMCIIRDASETGMSIRLFHELPDCGQLMLELQNGDRHELELVWQDQDRAGLRFLGDVDISRIIECPSRFAKRPIRISLQVPAVLASLTGKAEAQVQDISQQGAKVFSEAMLAIDQRVKFSAEGLPQVNAKIRWRRENEYGLIFEDTFQFGDFARMIAGMQLAEIT